MLQKRNKLNQFSENQFLFNIKLQFSCNKIEVTLQQIKNERT